ncbi:MAG: anti-sigma factor [Pseudomonadota bacterium]
MNPQQALVPKGAGEDPDRLAGEYVLGTLSAVRRRGVEARLPQEPGLRAAVAAWEARLLPLTTLAPPVDPSAGLWARIDRSTAPAIAPTIATETPAVAPVPAKRVDTARPGVAGWWNSLPFWRGLATGGLALAAVLASVLLVRQGAPQALPQYLVVLVAPLDKSPGWVVETSAPGQLNLIPLGSTAVPPEKSLQFWTKADGWSGPVSLGLVKPGQVLRVPLEKLPPLQPNQLFELTLEPAAGSPLDRPTGPIQFIGRAVKVT